MSRKKGAIMRIAGLVLISILFATLLLSFLPIHIRAVRIEGDLYLSGNDEYVVENDVLEVNGSIYLSDNAVLVLRNATLKLIGPGRVIFLNKSGSGNRPKIVAVNSTIIASEGASIKAEMLSRIFLDNSTIHVPLMLGGQTVLISLNSILSNISATDKVLAEVHNSTALIVELGGEARMSFKGSNIEEVSVSENATLIANMSTIRRLTSSSISTMEVYNSRLGEVFVLNTTVVVKKSSVETLTLRLTSASFLNSSVKRLSGDNFNLTVTKSTIEDLNANGNINLNISLTTFNILKLNLSEAAKILCNSSEFTSIYLIGNCTATINNSKIESLTLEPNIKISILNSNITRDLTLHFINSSVRIMGFKPGYIEYWNITEEVEIQGLNFPRLEMTGIKVANWSINCINTRLEVLNSSLNIVEVQANSTVYMYNSSIGTLISMKAFSVQLEEINANIVKIGGSSRVFMANSSIYDFALQDDVLALVEFSNVSSMSLRDRAMLVTIESKISVLNLELIQNVDTLITISGVKVGIITEAIYGISTPILMARDTFIEGWVLKIGGFSRVKILDSEIRMLQAYGFSNITISDSWISDLKACQSATLSVKNSIVDEIEVLESASVRLEESGIGLLYLNISSLGRVSTFKARIDMLRVDSGNIETLDSTVSALIGSSGVVKCYRTVRVTVLRPDGSPLGPFNLKIESELGVMNAKGSVNGIAQFQLLYRAMIEGEERWASNFTVTIIPYECPSCRAILEFSAEEGLEPILLEYRYQYFTMSLNTTVNSDEILLGRPFELSVKLQPQGEAPINGSLIVYLDGRVVNRLSVNSDHINIDVWPVKSGKVTVKVKFVESSWYSDAESIMIIKVDVPKEPVVLTVTKTEVTTKIMHIVDIGLLIYISVLIILLIVAALLLYRYGNWFFERIRALIPRITPP